MLVERKGLFVKGMALRVMRERGFAGIEKGFVYKGKGSVCQEKGFACAEKDFV